MRYRADELGWLPPFGQKINQAIKWVRGYLIANASEHPQEKKSEAISTREVTNNPYLYTASLALPPNPKRSAYRVQSLEGLKYIEGTDKLGPPLLRPKQEKSQKSERSVTCRRDSKGVIER